jgi:hypothetical protein
MDFSKLGMIFGEDLEVDIRHQLHQNPVKTVISV